MSKGRYTLGVVADHSRCTCQATSFSNKVRRHVAATNRFLCTGNFFENICLRNRILSLQRVAKNQIGLNLCDLLQRQNSVAATKIFTKILPVRMERFVAAMCHLVSTNLNEVDVEDSERATLASYFILVRILYKQKTSQKKGGPWFPLDHPLICPWLYLITINNYSFFLCYSLK